MLGPPLMGFVIGPKTQYAKINSFETTTTKTSDEREASILSPEHET